MVEDRLARRELEGEVGRHAGSKILGLMVDEEMDVAEADAEEALPHLAGERDEPVGPDLERAGALRWLDRVARRAVVERRQDDEVHLLLDQVEHPGDGEGVHADRHVLAVILEDA